MPEFVDMVKALADQFAPFLTTPMKSGPHAEALAEFQKEQKLFAEDVERFRARMDKAAKQWESTPDTNGGLNKLFSKFLPLAEASCDPLLPRLMNGEISV